MLNIGWWTGFAKLDDFMLNIGGRGSFAKL